MDHNPDHASVTIALNPELAVCIDILREEWGMRNRGEVLERLLEELFDQWQT